MTPVIDHVPTDAATPESDPNPAPHAVHRPLHIARLKLVLFPARAFLALGWTRAGIEKLIEHGWWTGDHVRRFVDDQRSEMLPFIEPTTGLIDGLSIVVAFVVLVAELAIGVCLITGKRLHTALLAASGLNVAFVAFGVVSPSAFYLVLQATLLFALASTTEPISLRKGRTVALVAGVLALALVPFVETVHPSEVIDDPAIMLATLAALVAFTQSLIVFNHR